MWGRRNAISRTLLLLFLAVGSRAPAQEIFNPSDFPPLPDSSPLIDQLFSEPSSSGLGGEPFGAEDIHQEGHLVRIPEPMVFDLVRPLGERKGAQEVNVLALFPMSRRGRRVQSTDPLGIVHVSRDPHEIEWAPEYEVAIADGLAIEFELPFEGPHLEAYKFAGQYTFGTLLDDKYIHGVQTIIEPTIDFANWNLVLLYIAGIRFDETWSALAMIGGRTATGPGITEDRTEMLFNLTVFADVGARTSLGFESNWAQSFDGNSALLLVPQIHYEITDHIMIQSGVGTGFDRHGVAPLAIMRAIYSF